VLVVVLLLLVVVLVVLLVLLLLLLLLLLLVLWLRLRAGFRVPRKLLQYARQAGGSGGTRERPRGVAQAPQACQLLQQCHVMCGRVSTRHTATTQSWPGMMCV
jgi:hypothetical protein